jgi:hypothetical protein
VEKGKGAAHILTIYTPKIYTAPCVRFLMRADTLCGEVGGGGGVGGLALEISSLVGPCEIGAQKTTSILFPYLFYSIISGMGHLSEVARVSLGCCLTMASQSAPRSISLHVGSGGGGFMCGVFVGGGGGGKHTHGVPAFSTCFLRGPPEVGSPHKVPACLSCSPSFPEI